MKILSPLILIMVLATACANISVTEVPSISTIPSPTLPPDCGTTTFGKAGTQTEESNHPVLVMGTVILCNYGTLFDEYQTVIPLLEAMLDLDTGSANIETADIGFSVSGTMNFYDLGEINNAHASIWSLNGLTGEHAPQPSFDECKELVNTYNNDNEPEYVCVITNEGHIARVKVEKYNPVKQVSSLEISFITWKEQVAKP
ncbi:MAG: hypothetical protein HZB50_10330 [Chloroflexi bacterium]|nr:hypothetical protein [Chloroflexota bacterium]